MTLTPAGMWSPEDTDQYRLITDLAAMMNSADNALGLRSGTAAQRTAYLATARNGVWWQDTDAAGMIWRKLGGVWTPAIPSWRGTTTQRNLLTSDAPEGFEWFDTTLSDTYVKRGTGWWPKIYRGVGSISTSLAQDATAQINPIVTFPAGMFTKTPDVTARLVNNNFCFTLVSAVTTSGATIRVRNMSGAVIPGDVEWFATQ